MTEVQHIKVQINSFFDLDGEDDELGFLGAGNVSYEHFPYSPLSQSS
jgi:hypothetical protein